MRSLLTLESFRYRILSLFSNQYEFFVEPLYRLVSIGANRLCRLYHLCVVNIDVEFLTNFCSSISYLLKMRFLTVPAFLIGANTSSPINELHLYRDSTGKQVVKLGLEGLNPHVFFFGRFRS